MKPGENLQQLVRTLEQATNNAPHIKVESPKRLLDKQTGELREHDVVLTHSLGHHTMVLALECRDRKRKVGVPDVEAFRHKRNNTGVHRAIIVSSTGFAKTALKKAEPNDIGCLGLEEVGRFDWCLTPAIEWHDRDLLQGPPWEIATAEDFDGELQLYDSEGKAIDAALTTNIAQHCLTQRPPELANVQDKEAESRPFTCTFINSDASSFYLINRSGNKIPLTHMTVHVTYKVRTSLIPLNFQQYIDNARGRELYTAAIAKIDRNNIKGDLVVHRSAEGTLKVTFVPTQIDVAT
jgi:hypothetical protein